MEEHLPDFDVTPHSENDGVTTYNVGCFTVERIVRGVSCKFTISFGGVIVRRDLYRLSDITDYITKHKSPRADVIPCLRTAARGGGAVTRLKPLIAKTPYARVDVGIALTVVGAGEIAMLSSTTPNPNSIFVPDSVYAPTGRWVHSIQFVAVSKRHSRPVALSCAG